jgi:hypothetical protein
MRQRGRKSAAAREIEPHAIIGASRLIAPSSLTKAEQKAFTELMACCDPAHFRESDVPLLISFVQATLAARKAARDPGKAARWERSIRLQMSLATKLRLSPQSRIDPETIGRQQMYQGPLRKPWEPVKPVPWEDECDDDHPVKN